MLPSGFVIYDYITRTNQTYCYDRFNINNSFSMFIKIYLLYILTDRFDINNSFSIFIKIYLLYILTDRFDINNSFSIFIKIYLLYILTDRFDINNFINNYLISLNFWRKFLCGY